MMPILLEQPVKLFFCWLIVQLVVTVYWRIKRDPPSIKAFWICVALLPALQTVCFYVVTPREQIQQICLRLADDVLQNDAASIAETIDESFEASGFDKDELVSRIKNTVDRYSLADIKLERIEVQFPLEQQSAAKETAVSEFDATAVIHSTEMQYEPILSRWRLTFIRKRSDDKKENWKITHIKVLPRPLSPIRSLRQCLQ